MQHSYRTKGWAKRLGAMAMTLVMLFGLMAAGLPQAQAVTQDDINNLKSQAASLSSQKADIQKKLDKLSNSKNSALNEKLLLEQKINVLRSEIAVSEQAIAEYGEMITQKESELAAAKEKEAKYYEAFCERVRSMEERGNVSYWSVIFNASSFSDLLDQVNAISEVMDYDNEIMDQLAKARQEVADAKTALEESKAAEETAKASLESQKADLQSQKKELDSQNSQMQSKQSELNSSISAAQMSAADAKKAQAAAQAAIESDELNYEAVKSQIQKLIAQAASSQPQLSFTGFICPLKSYSRISSEYGWRKNPVSGVNKLHAGIDLAAGGGTPIYAAASGYVQVAGWSSGGYGNYVIIYHGKMSDGNTYSTLYGHMKSVATSAGKYVKQGELIGYVGSTGNSTGNHLHLEVWKGGSKANAVNPRGYIPFPHN